MSTYSVWKISPQTGGGRLSTKPRSVKRASRPEPNTSCTCWHRAKARDHRIDKMASCGNRHAIGRTARSGSDCTPTHFASIGSTQISAHSSMGNAISFVKGVGDVGVGGSHFLPRAELDNDISSLIARSARSRSEKKLEPRAPMSDVSIPLFFKTLTLYDMPRLSSVQSTSPDANVCNEGRAVDMLRPEDLPPSLRPPPPDLATRFTDKAP